MLRDTVTSLKGEVLEGAGMVERVRSGYRIGGVSELESKDYRTRGLLGKACNTSTTLNEAKS